MDMKSSNPNPNSCYPKEASHFLTSLALINQGSTATSHRIQHIKLAAYASMARAAAPRRAWGRALLRRILNRPRAVVVRPRVRILRPHRRDAEGLRRLVPGGKAMDLSSLLEETADYIQSLAAQVKLMQAIVDSASE